MTYYEKYIKYKNKYLTLHSYLKLLNEDTLLKTKGGAIQSVTPVGQPVATLVGQPVTPVVTPATPVVTPAEQLDTNFSFFTQFSNRFESEPIKDAPIINEIIRENKILQNAIGNIMTDLNFDKWENYIGYSTIMTVNNETKEYNFDIIQVSSKTLDMTHPTLVVMAGVSSRSFCSTSQVISGNIELLLTKFSQVFMINLQTFKKSQNKSCEERDMIISDKINEKYAPEIIFNNMCAEIINNIIINILGLNNVHLLGKCAGAGIAINMIKLCDIYKGLYLAVPSIPNNVEPLEEIKDKIKDMVFKFSWNSDDTEKITWVKDKFNKDEKSMYDEKMKLLGVKYTSSLYIGKHEVSDMFIADIIKL